MMGVQYLVTITDRRRDTCSEIHAAYHRHQERNIVAEVAQNTGRAQV